MSRPTRDGTTEPVSRDQIIGRERGQGKTSFSCPTDHEQEWQPYPADPYSAIRDDHTYIMLTLFDYYWRSRLNPISTQFPLLNPISTQFPLLNPISTQFPLDGRFDFSVSKMSQNTQKLPCQVLNKKAFDRSMVNLLCHRSFFSYKDNTLNV